MSETAERSPGLAGTPPGRPATGQNEALALLRRLRRAADQAARGDGVRGRGGAVPLLRAQPRIFLGLRLEGQPCHAVLQPLERVGHRDHRTGRGAPADLRRDRPLGRLRRRVRPLPHALPDRLLRLPRPARDPLRAAVGSGSRPGERLLHGHARLALVHHHAGHELRPARAHRHHLPRRAGHDPGGRAGHRQVDRHLLVGGHRLGGRAHRGVPHRAHPDPLGPAHDRRRAGTCSARARPASTSTGSSTATS